METFHTSIPGILSIVDAVGRTFFADPDDGAFREDEEVMQRFECKANKRLTSLESVPFAYDVVNVLGLAVKDESDWDEIRDLEISIGGRPIWKLPISLLRQIALPGRSTPTEIYFPPNLLYHYINANVIPYRVTRAIHFQPHAFDSRKDDLAVEVLLNFRFGNVRDTEQIRESDGFSCYESFLIHQHREKNHLFGTDTQVVATDYATLFTSGVFFIVHSGEDLGDSVTLEMTKSFTNLTVQTSCPLQKVTDNMYYISLCGLPDWKSTERPPYTINYGGLEHLAYIFQKTIGKVEIIPVTLNGLCIIPQKRLVGPRYED